MTLYLGLKYVHILLAMLAVGLSASYNIWLRRAARDPENLAYVTQGIRFIDSRITNPAFLGVALVGLVMTFIAGLPLTTFWVAAALVLYVGMALLGALLYAPLFRRLRQALDTDVPDVTELERLVRRSNLITLLLGLMILVIVFLMVFKPTL